MKLSTRIVNGRTVLASAGQPIRPQPRGNSFEPTRLRILERDGYRCQLGLDGCTGWATEVDHVVPRGRGGDDSDRNLQAACRHCNLKKGAS